METPRSEQVQDRFSPEFRTAAQAFCLEPERLARLLCDEFAEHPPQRIVIISRVAAESDPAGVFPSGSERAAPGISLEGSVCGVSSCMAQGLLQCAL